MVGLDTYLSMCLVPQHLLDRLVAKRNHSLARKLVDQSKHALYEPSNHVTMFPLLPSKECELDRFLLSSHWTLCDWLTSDKSDESSDDDENEKKKAPTEDEEGRMIVTIDYSKDTVFNYAALDEHRAKHTKRLLRGARKHLRFWERNVKGCYDQKRRKKFEEEEGQAKLKERELMEEKHRLEEKATKHMQLESIDLGPFTNGDWSQLSMDVFRGIMSYLTDARTMCTVSLVSKSWLTYVNLLAKEEFIRRWPTASEHFVEEQIIRFRAGVLKDNWIREVRDQTVRDESLRKGTYFNLYTLWSPVHFLLTETEEDGDYPLNFLRHGGHSICEMRHGDARAFSSQQVKEIEEAIRQLNLPSVMELWKDPFDHYFPVHARLSCSPIEDIHLVLHFLLSLRLFLQHAVSNFSQYSLVVFATKTMDEDIESRKREKEKKSNLRSLLSNVKSWVTSH